MSEPSREERTLRTLLLIARRLHELTNDSSMEGDTPKSRWEAECLKWRGRVLTGKFCHYCPDWDELPVDETTPEWDCGCFAEDQNGV